MLCCCSVGIGMGDMHRPLSQPQSNMPVIVLIAINLASFESPVVTTTHRKKLSSEFNLTDIVIYGHKYKYLEDTLLGTLSVLEGSSASWQEIHGRITAGRACSGGISDVSTPGSRTHKENQVLGENRQRDSSKWEPHICNNGNPMRKILEQDAQVSAYVHASAQAYVICPCESQRMYADWSLP
ncbi:hypothetical protein STEG23_028106, partial [Scotinomys teguina]